MISQCQSEQNLRIGHETMLKSYELEVKDKGHTGILNACNISSHRYETKTNLQRQTNRQMDNQWSLCTPWTSFPVGKLKLPFIYRKKHLHLDHKALSSTRGCNLGWIRTEIYVVSSKRQIPVFCGLYILHEYFPGFFNQFMKR